jgi:hypothetical protein
LMTGGSSERSSRDLSWAVAAKDERDSTKRGKVRGHGGRTQKEVIDFMGFSDRSLG